MSNQGLCPLSAMTTPIPSECDNPSGRDNPPESDTRCLSLYSRYTQMLDNMLIYGILCIYIREAALPLTLLTCQEGGREGRKEGGGRTDGGRKRGRLGMSNLLFREAEEEVGHPQSSSEVEHNPTVTTKLSDGCTASVLSVVGRQVDEQRLVSAHAIFVHDHRHEME